MRSTAADRPVAGRPNGASSLTVWPTRNDDEFNVKNKLDTGLNLLKKGDYRRLAHTIQNKFLRPLFRYDNFYILHCEELKNQKLCKPLDDSYSVSTERFSAALLNRLNNELSESPPSLHYRTKGREQRTHAIYIEHRGRIVSRSFVLFDEIYISPSGYELPMGQVVAQVHGAYVDPQYRWKGLHLHMLRNALDLSLKKGTPGAYSEIHFLNRNSYGSYNKLGFRIYKNIKYVAILGRKYFFEGEPTHWTTKRAER